MQRSKVLCGGSFCFLGVIGVLFSSFAFGECKDIVLRMQDPNLSKQDRAREITMFLNCHGGSYQIPEATTINMFEWKNGELCHSHRVCGNVSYWNGHFGIGAAWNWGSSISKFVSNSNFVNDFEKLADGALPAVGGNAGDINTNDRRICIDRSIQGVINLGGAGAAAGSAKCYQKNEFDDYGWKKFCERNPSIFGFGLGSVYQPGNYESQCQTTILSPKFREAKNICIDKSETKAKADLEQNGVAKKSVDSCNTTNVNNSSGGNGGDGYSPVFGIKSGSSNSSGNIATDFDSTLLHVNFSMDFGQIERYCSEKQEEVCF